MKFCLVVSLVVLCISFQAADAAGRKKIKSWSTTSTTAATSSSTTTTTTTTTTVPPTTTTTKSSEKVIYPKKVTSLKKRPTKTSTGPNHISTKLSLIKRKPSDVTEKFKNLPAEDLAFIKALDKQFALHGEKIKIKVENDNATTSTSKSKNSKRTVDGELGYGYDAHNGYNYDPPKFMFYPYSQADISADAPEYHPPKTEVTIQPSYSYELQPQTYAVPNEEPQIDLPHTHSAEEIPQQQQQHQQQPQELQHQQQYQQTDEKYSEPVIVLRIPGPAKYASHLQALLQQYLEIRAAQYLRLLEEAELRKQQQYNDYPQQYEQQQYEQQYEQQYDQNYEHQQQEQYEPQQQQQQHHQQLGYNNNVQQQKTVDDSAQYVPDVNYAPAPEPASYPPIDDVYQGYKARQQQAPHYSQPEVPPQDYYPAEQGYQTPEDPQQYYYPQQQQQHQVDEERYAPAVDSGNSHNSAYPQDVYLISMQPQQGYYPADAEQENEQQQQQQQHQQQPQQSYEYDQNEQHNPAISENNPRGTHTKVRFNAHNTDNGGADYNTMYQLPSIRPYERRAPTSRPSYHQQYEQQQQQAESLDYQHVSANGAAQQEAVAITQRPYNYHAHGLRRTRGRKRGTALKTATTGDTEHRLEKIKEYVRDKLGAEMGSAVEIKSTHIINHQ